MIYSLYLQQQLAQPWLVHPAYVQQMLPTLAAMLKGETIGTPADFAAQREASRPQIAQLNLSTGLVVSMGPRASMTTVGDAPTPANVATILVLHLRGVMLKDDQMCGPSGTESLARELIWAFNNPDIDAVVLKIDSPGGQAYGTQTLADTIAAAPKPVVGFINDGYACSAAQWVGAACVELIASHPTCQVGSIGTMCSWADVQPVLVQQGVVFHEVYAPASTEKNRTYRDAVAGNYAPLEGFLGTLNDAFVASVKARRPELKLDAAEKAGVFAGASLFADKALAVGLITAIGDFDFALQRAATLAQEGARGIDAPDPSASSSTQSPPMFGFLKLPAVAALVGLDPAAVTPALLAAAQTEMTAAGIPVAVISQAQLEQPDATPDAALRTQLTSANHDLDTTRQELAAAANDRDAAQADLATNTAALTTVNANLAIVTAERDEALALAADYGARAGVEPTSVVPDGDESEVTSAAKQTGADAEIAAELARSYGIR